MFSSVLFKKTIKSNYKVVSIFIGVMIFYSVIIIGMFDPNDLSVINSISEMKFPPELLSAFGFDLSVVNLTGFIASFLYGMIMLVFPMIAYIIVSNRIIASLVDKGSMACLLSTPKSRVKIASTQAFALINLIALMIISITAITIIFAQTKYNGHLEIDNFIKMNVGLFILHFMISSICFCSSCIFNESRKSLLYGAGIPIFMYVVQMLKNASPDLNSMKYLTLFSLYDGVKIANGANYNLQFVVMLLIGIAFYITGIFIFNKKDLPI